MRQRALNLSVAHKSTGGIPHQIPEPVGPVGNAALTPNTVALPVCAFGRRPQARARCLESRRPLFYT